MRSFAGVPFYMYRPERLLEEAGKRGLVGESASAGTLDEIEDLGSLDDSLPARKSQVDLLRVLAAEVWGERGVEKLEAAAGKPLARMSRVDADLWIDALTGDLPREPPGASREPTDEIPYPELRRAGVPLAGYTDRLLTDLRSRSFDRQKSAVRTLNAATAKGELFALPGPLQEDLGRALLVAAEGVAGYGSFAAQDLLETIRSSPGGWPERFVAGLLSGALLDDGGRFDLKASHAAEALEIAATHPEVEAVVNRVAQAVGALEPPEELTSVFVTADGSFDDFEIATGMIEDAKAAAPARAGVLDALIKAVRAAAPEKNGGSGEEA